MSFSEHMISDMGYKFLSLCILNATKRIKNKWKKIYSATYQAPDVKVITTGRFHYSLYIISLNVSFCGF